MICKGCKKDLLDSEFYGKHCYDKNGKDRGYIHKKCKRCIMLNKGVKNIGQHESQIKIFESGNWKCCTCKIIKPLTEFCSNRSYWTKHNASCRKCMFESHSGFYQNAKENISKSYLNIWIHQQWQIPSSIITDELRKTAKEIVLARRATKKMFHFNGMKFCKREFAVYLNKKYGISIHRTEKRIEMGKNEKECLISEKELRSARSKPLIFIDTKTNKTLRFKGIKYAQRGMNIGDAMIRECLLSGEPTRLYNNSKTKSTYFIHYDKREKIAARI